MEVDRTRKADLSANPGLRWAIWLAVLAAYSYLLVAPNDWLPPWLRATTGTKLTDEFTLGKLAHAIWYGVLTVAVFWLPLGGWGRAWCVAWLVVHGFATEYAQTFTGRNGRWLDVLIDNIGIAVALLLRGLSGYLRRAGPDGRRPQRVAAAPQVQQHAGGKDEDADPL
jgi:VanZ family protein